MKDTKQTNTLYITQTALIASIALVLSYIEMLIPDIPFLLPGMKLGLSNIAVMFALSVLNLPSALFVCLVKAIFALLMRGFTAFLMSLCGGILSCLVMFLLLSAKKVRFGYIGIGVSGAFFHNFGQLLVSVLLTDKAVFAYTPVICVSALVTGTLTAIVLYLVMPAVTKTSLFYIQNSSME